MAGGGLIRSRTLHSHALRSLLIRRSRIGAIGTGCSMAYDDNNVFAKILRGEIPSKKVHEDAHTLAFHDIHPARPVHVLVIPKGKYVDFTDFTARASAAEQTAFYKTVAAAAKAVGVIDSGYRLIANTGVHGGQEVPHFHMHILGGGGVGPMVSR